MKKMAKKVKKDYLGLDWIVSLILVIIPVTAWVLGVVVRIQEGKLVAGIIRIFFGWLAWIPDIVFMVWKGQICRLLNV